MRATLTIDDDVAEILEKRCKDENKPFEQVVNDALRRETSANTTLATDDDDPQPAKNPIHIKPHNGKWMAGDDPARLKEILEEEEVENYLRSIKE